MKFSVFLILFWAMSWMVVAQPTNTSSIDPSLAVLPPSPSAAGLAKYIDFPISYASGTPQISVPIYTLSGRGISVPISLSYHAGGVRVDDIASCVGLNWNLNAGGAVTRTVVGKADERPDGFLQRGAQIPYPINSSTNFNDLEEFGEGRWDSQPDVFNFNFGAYSGKFVLEPHGVVRLIPRQDVEVTYSLCTNCAFPLTGSIISFAIRTPDGTVYTFGTSEAVEFSETSSYNPSGGNLACNVKNYDVPVATAWYLKTIHHPKTNDRMDFHYSDKVVNYDLSYHESYLIPVSPIVPSGCSETSERTLCVSNKTDNGVILDSIVSSYGKVTFVNDRARSDISTSLGSNSWLREIHIKGRMGGLLKKFKLVQFFVSASGNTPSDKPQSAVRMYLDEVEEYSAEDVLVNQYAFGYYNRDQLPPRLSFSQDHWGHFNGKSNSQLTPFPYNDHLLNRLQSHHSSFRPADREVDVTKSSYGLLNEVTYPTGGQANFAYESNEYGICQDVTRQEEIIERLYARWTSSNGGQLKRFAFTLSDRQEVEVTYDVRQIGLLQNGAYARLMDDATGQALVSVGASLNSPFDFKGSQTMWLDPGDYTLEVQVFRGPDPNFDPPFDSEPEHAQIAVRRQESRTETLVNQAVGGLRVKQVTYDDGDGNANNNMIRRYDYRKDVDGCERSTAVLLGRVPIYTTFEQRISLDGQPQCGFIPCHYQRFSSSSVVNLTSNAGSVVNYEEVWELHGANGENGQKYMRFQLFKDSNSELGPNAPVSFFNSPMVDRSYMNGKMIEEQVLNAAGQMMSQRLWDYEFFERRLEERVKGMLIKKLYNPPCNSTTVFRCDGVNEEGEEYYFLPNYCDPIQVFGLNSLHYNNCDTLYGPCWDRPEGFTILNPAGYEHLSIEWYDAISQWVYLKSETNRIYDMDGSGDYVETVTQYGYDLPQGRHTMPTQTVVTNSDGKEHKTVTTYSPERTDAMATALQSWHMIVPMETQTLVDGQIVDGKRYTYSYFDQAGLPTYSLSSHPPLLYRISRREISWSSGGQLIDDGWDIKAFIGEYDPVYWMPKKVVQDGWQPDLYTWTDGLVTRRQYKDFIWQYEYDPNSRLMTRTTDIDGQVIDYTYDGSMRLQTTSSRSGNVVTSYEYNYQDGNTKNYVKTRTDFTPTVGSDLHWTESWQYLDGLGRPIQSVQRQHSPDQKDVVTAMEYDKQGRVFKQYIPFESSNDDGSYTAIPANTKHRLTAFEPSPLNRSISITPPSWYATTTAYKVNKAAEVLNLNTNNYYAAGELSKTVVTDPNGNQQISYVDKMGRQILGHRTSGQSTESAKTFYLYDDKNRVQTIVPPEASLSDADLLFTYLYDGRDNVLEKKIPSQAAMKMRYDERNLLVFSQDGNQAAQNEWLHVKYDSYGRVKSSGFYTGSNPSPFLSYPYTTQLTQTTYDGSSPINKGKVYFHQDRILGTNDWIKKIYYYDIHGRNHTISGNNALNQSMGKEVMQISYDYADNVLSQIRRHQDGANALTKITNRTNYDHKGRLTNAFHQINNEPEVRIANHQYNHRDFLTQKNLHYTGNAYLQNIDYGYNAQGWITRINDFCEVDSELPELPELDPPVRGLQNLELEIEFNTIDFQTVAESINFGMSVTADVILEDGQAIQRQKSRQVEVSNLQSDQEKIIQQEGEEKTYAQRIQISYQDVMAEAADMGELLLEIEEQVSLRLEEKGVNTYGDLIATQLQGLIEQTVIFRPKEDQGRQQIPQRSFDPPPSSGGSADLFAMRLDYDIGNTDLNIPAQYNGNIASTQWQVGCNNIQLYGYRYDYQDRLTRANYVESDFQTSNYIHYNRYNVIGLRYDDRGNIDRLFRRGQRTPTTYSYIDRLHYDYTGNQLTELAETGLASHRDNGFKTAIPSGVGEYTYDANGNMITDEHKGISNIAYNHLNLPERIDWTDGRWIEWTYDASGVKLKKERSDGVVKHYQGDIEYDGTQIEAIYHSEGRATPNGGRYRYEYSLKDHLGNTRVTFADVDGSGTVDTSEILQENHYYPFGMLMKGEWGQSGGNQYQYNGKELNEDFGLEWLDYGARWYEAAIGRWHVVDPLAEKYFSFSGYNYVAGNPIRYIDIDGRVIGNPNSSDAKYLKNVLSKTEAGKKLWQQMEKHESTIHIHVTDFIDVKGDQKHPEYNLAVYAVEAADGYVANDKIFKKIKNGDFGGITFEDGIEGMTFDSKTGEYINLAPENMINHLVIDKSAIQFTADQYGSPYEKVELETVAEEAAHTLQEYYDPGILYKKKDTNGEYRPLTKAERAAVDKKIMNSMSAYERNYNSQRNEKEAKQIAREVVRDY